MANLVEIIIKGANESKAAFTEADAQGHSLGDTMGKLGTVGAVALGAIAVASIDMSSKFQAATTRLVTSAGESDKNIDMVRQGMLKMSVDVGTSSLELAKGMYVVESAGYHGAAGLTVLKAAAQGAKDENAQLETVANAVTDVLVDYHLKASDAADVTSKMVTAVSFGKTNFQDFAGAMHNILPLAASMHLSFADVSGVLAEMTAHGMSADQASQDMANTMRELIAPTNAMTKEWKLFGITAQDVQTHLSQQGLAGTLQWLSTVAKDGSKEVGQNYDQALKKLVGTAPALATALMVTGENAKNTTAAIKGIASASTDASGNVKGFGDVQKTLAFQTDQLKAFFEQLAITIGDKLIPVVTAATTFFTQHRAILSILVDAVIALTAALTAYWVISKAVAVAQAALNVVMAASTIGLVIIAVAALVAGFVILWDKSAGFRDFWKTAWQDIQHAVEAAINFIKNLWDQIVGWLKPPVDAFVSFWKTEFDVVKQVVTDAVNIIKGIWNTVTSILETVIKTFEAYWTAEWDLIKAAVSTAVGVIRSVWSALEGILEAPFKAAESVIMGILHGIEDAISAVSSAINGLVGVAKSVGSGIGSALNAVGLASGGVVGADGGGARGGFTLVGEHGAELVKLPYGSQVYSNSQTMGMLGSGGGTQNIQLEIVPGSNSQFEDFMLELIRRFVRVKGGGNVQRTFGF